MKNPTNNQSNAIHTENTTNSPKELQIDYKKLTKAVIEYHEKQKAKDLADHKRSQVKATRDILKHYRSFKICAEESISTMKEAKDTLDRMLNDIILLKSETTVQSIYRTKERTLIMIAHIDNVINIYRTICQQSDNPRDIERFEEVYSLYLCSDRKPKTVVQLAHELHKDKSTIYDDITKVCEDLAPLIFGIQTF